MVIEMLLEGARSAYLDLYKEKEASGSRWASGRRAARTIAQVSAVTIKRELRTSNKDIGLGVVGAPGYDEVIIVADRTGDLQPRVALRYWIDGSALGSDLAKELERFAITGRGLGIKSDSLLYLVGVNRKKVKQLQHRIKGIKPTIIPDLGQQIFLLPFDEHPRISAQSALQGQFSASKSASASTPFNPDLIATLGNLCK